MSAVLKPVAPAVYSVAEFDEEAAALAGLRQRLKGIAYEAINTGAGMQAAIDDRAALRGLRVDLGKRVEQLNKADRAATKVRCDGRDLKLAELTTEVKALEGPIDDQIKAEEARKEKARLEREAAEAARKKKHVDAASKINSYATIARAQKFSIERIDAGIAFVETIDTSAAVFEEFAGIASAAKVDVLNDLRAYRAEVVAEAERVAREKAQAEENTRLRAEKERVEREAAELRARLAAAEAAAKPVAAAQVPVGVSLGGGAEGAVSPAMGEPLSKQAPITAPVAAAFGGSRHAAVLHAQSPITMVEPPPRKFGSVDVVTRGGEPCLSLQSLEQRLRVCGITPLLHDLGYRPFEPGYYLHTDFTPMCDALSAYFADLGQV